MFRKWSLAIVPILFSMQSVASELPDFPFVVVTGEAQVDVAPDEATVSFHVVAFDEDAETAMATVLERGAQILGLVEKYGMQRDSLRSYGLNKETRRSRSDDYQALQILGYEVMQRYELKFGDLSVYPGLMYELTALQNTAGFRAGFGLSDEDTVLRSLVKAASEDARQHASDLAAGLDVEITSVFAVSEGTQFSAFFAKFAMDEFALRAAPADPEGGRVVTMSVPKSIPISKAVNVVFRIEP